MSESRKQPDWSVVVTLVLVLILVVGGAYVGGYFAIGSRQNVMFDKDNDGTSGRIIFVRVYDARWKARLFQPASDVESLITGDDVYTSPGLIGYRGQ